MWRGYSLSTLLHTAILLLLVAGLPTLPGILDQAVEDAVVSEAVPFPVDRDVATIAASLSGEDAADPDRRAEPPGPDIISFDVDILVIREGGKLPFAEPPPAASETPPAPPRADPDTAARHAETLPAETQLTETPPAPTTQAQRSTPPPPDAAASAETPVAAEERIASAAASPPGARPQPPAAVFPRAATPATRLDAALAEVAKLDARLADTVAPPPDEPKTAAELAREKRIFERVNRAAGRGYPHAQYNLARMLLKGRGEERNPEAAQTWLERSAERGYIPAQLLLGYIAAGGMGGKPDLGTAEFWWSVAERRGDQAARRGRELIDPLMSANDVLTARRLRAQWHQVTSILATEVHDPRDLQAVNAQLHEGALQGDSAAVLDALMRGADADSRDEGGRNAMINAAWRGRTEVLELMLENGADIEAADDNHRTALMWGAINGHRTIVERLLDAGSNPDRADREGVTALMRAAWNGHPTVVETLLRAGADVHRRDRQGMSALAHAEREGHAEIVRRLRAAR